MSDRSGLSTTARVDVPKRVRRSRAQSNPAMESETSRVPSWSSPTWRCPPSRKVETGKMGCSWWSWGQMSEARAESAARMPTDTTITTSAATPASGRNRASSTTPMTGATTKKSSGMATQAVSPQLSCSSQ